MDRLISLEPSNVVMVRIEPGKKCSGEVTLRNVMYTMPVAYRLQPVNKSRYTVRPPSGIIPPLNNLTVEIIYHPLPGTLLPEMYPVSDDSFLLHSVVAPGATALAGEKERKTGGETVPNDWFTTRKKQVFIDSGIKVMFVGSPVLAALVSNGLMDDLREVLERSDPSWKAVDSVDDRGRPLLHLAIEQGRPDLVQLLLEFGPDLEAQNRASGSSPLEAAAAAGEALIVEILLANRASPDRARSSNRGPIHLAAGNGHADVLRLLILKGANVNAFTKDGNTALHLAVEERRRDCARLLIAAGARLDARNSGDGNTALHVSVGNGDEQMARLLLQKGAEKNIRNRYGKTAYDIALENGHSCLFDALRLGDNLCAAARKGDSRTIQKLLDCGANVNGKDQNGWTALHRASFKGRVDAVRLLIDNGIDINARDDEGYTALHCAVEAGHVDVTELLVKKGAEVEAKTNKGITALQIAESLRFSGITRILAVQGVVYRDVIANKLVNNSTNLDKLDLQMMSKHTLEKKTERKMNRGRVSRRSFDLGQPLAVV